MTKPERRDGTRRVPATSSFGFRASFVIWVSSFVILLAPGCAGTATTALSAADVIERAADAQDQTVAEYHGDVAAGDDAREAGIAAAFVARIRGGEGDEGEHIAAFLAAGQKIRADREVAWVRRENARANTSALREVAAGLRRIGLDSLSLTDEARRYFGGWMAARKQREASDQAASDQRRVERQTQIQSAGGTLLDLAGAALRNNAAKK